MMEQPILTEPRGLRYARECWEVDPGHDHCVLCDRDDTAQVYALPSGMVVYACCRYTAPEGSRYW